MTTQAYSQRHLISVAELASAIATARGTAGIDELRELASQAEGGALATLPLYPPHQLWQHRGDVNRIGVPTENPVVIWRMLATKVCKPHLSDKDAFNYPPAASTWHMLAADVYGLGMTRSLNRRAAAALRELAIRYSPELGDDEAEMLKPVTGPAEHVAEPALRVVLVTDQVEPEAPQELKPVTLQPTAEPELNLAPQAVPVVDIEIVATVTEALSPRPLQRQHAQEQAIMRLIRDEGHDPRKLPKNEPGKPGVKAKVRKALQSNPIFTGATVFEKAWERLRNGNEIADQP